MSEDTQRIVSALLLVGFGYYAGAMFNFFPFSMWKDSAVGAVGFATVVICVVVVLCTNEILAAVKGKKDDENENQDSQNQE